MKYFFILLVLISSNLMSAVVLNNEQDIYDKFIIGHIYDDTSNLSIEDVKNKTFKNISNNFTFGYIEGISWFKIEIKNTSDKEEYILSFSEAIWKNFDLYYIKDDGFDIVKNGLDVALRNRTIKDVNPAFNINIARNSAKTFYIKAKTISSQIGSFSIISSDVYYNPSKITITHIYIIFSFIFLIIAILNIYSYFLTKDSLYIYYIYYIIFSIFFIAMQSGLYLILDIDGWNEGLHLIGTFLVLFLLLFSDKFLDLKNNTPLIHTFFKFSIMAVLVFSIIIYNNVPYSSVLFNIYSTLIFIVLFYAVIKVFILGALIAKFYLIALLIYTPLMSLMILTFNSLLDYSLLTRHIYLGGSLIEIIFFTLILSSKYRSIILDKIKAKEKLLDEKTVAEEKAREALELFTQEVEKNRIQEQKLLQQSKLAQMGELVSMIAHQWRQPLSAISSISINLQMKVELKSFNLNTIDGQEKQNKYFLNELKTIDELIQNLTTTMDDFRGFYKQNKEKTYMSFMDLINHAMIIIKNSLVMSNTKIIYDIEDNTSITVYKNELIQVILNIIKNSIDNAVEKKIASPKIYISAAKNKITFCDNGGGIPDDIIDKIFDPYFSTKGKDGTGLGLYMSKSIVESHHNGKLLVYNKNSGACFDIEIGEI